MRKLFKSRKALSPVVAAIILIAVTVAVSIAVAAWMGALTFSFTATEQVSITNLQFLNNNTIRVTMRNSGTTPVTINEAWVNNVQQSTTNPTLPTTVSANSVAYLNITYTYTNGDNYEVKLVSSKGNTFLRSGTAPA